MVKVEQVKQWVRELARSQGFYGRLEEALNENDAWDEFVDRLNDNGCDDVVDMVLFVES